MVSTAPAEGDLRVRKQAWDDRLLRLAFVVSSTGDWVYRFALPLLVLEITGSALSTASMFAVEFAPYIVVGLVAGVVADRVDRRRLMVGCDLLSTVLVGCIAVICLLPDPPLPALYLLALLLSSVRPFYFPAFQGFIVDRVEPTRRPVVNAWVQGTDSALNLTGPAVGVAIVVTLGAATASWINAGSFLISGLLIALTSTGAPGITRGLGETVRFVAQRVWPDFVAGLRVLVRLAPLLWGTMLMSVTNVAVPAVEGNLVYILAGSGGGSGAAALALVVALQGAGSLLGAVVAPALMRRIPVGPLLCTAMGVLVAVLAAPAASRAVAVLAVAWFLNGVAMSLIIVPWFTYRQGIVESSMTGRVVAVSRSIAYASIPIGAVAGGWVLVRFGHSWLFVMAGGIQLLAWVGCLVSPLRSAGRQATVDAQEANDV